MTDVDGVSVDGLSIMELGDRTDMKILNDRNRSSSFNVIRANTKSSRAVIDFTERQQSLSVLVKRLSSGALIDPADAARFSLELLNFHAVASSVLASHFQTNISQGLSKDTIVTNLAKYGPHSSPKVVETPMWKKFFFCFVSGFAPLLWIACFFVFLSWEPFGTPPSNIYNLALAIALLIVIFVSGLFTFSQEMQTSLVLSSFSSMVPPECLVIREGKSIHIPVSEIVVGDLLILETGSRIAADIRIVSTANLRVDKSILTGESLPVRLTEDKVSPTVTSLEAPNMAFMGCNVVEGGGTGIVIATGPNCQLAKIAEQVNVQAPPLTTLQVEINRLAFIVAGIAVLVTIAVVLEWAFFLRVEHNSFMNTSTMIANAIGILVAFVPEGLPLALSMGLTIIASRLCVTYSILVKQLGTIETLGSISFLASDKTGTLTQNKMTVTALVVVCNGPELIQPLDQPNESPQAAAIQRGAVLCNQSKLEMIPGQSVPVVVGSNGVDKALMEYALKANVVEDFQNAYVERALLPFSSATKLTAVVVGKRDVKSGGFSETVVLVKGAYEYILERCKYYLDSNGMTQPISKEFADDVNNALLPAVTAGHRIVILAQSPVLSEAEYPADFEFKLNPTPNFPIDGLVFLACFVISDPPRDGVKQAIAELRGAGIRVSMVTGDAAPTAAAIAKNVGIITSSAVDRIADMSRNRQIVPAIGAIVDADVSSVSSSKSRESAIVVEGRELENIEPVQWDFIFSHSELVFARTTPAQKLMIVKQCQARGFRVGVTGDGVNDSPALKCADIGIAMQSGSDVARDAADIVLLKDDFNSVVQGVREGRLIFTNLRKVIAYQMSAGCWGEVLPVLATFFIGLPQPLCSFLMIVVSCVSDVFAGIALTREKAEATIMSEPPRDLVRERLVDMNIFLYSYMFYGNLISVGCFYSYFVYMASRGPTRELGNPLPADDDGSRSFPVGYRASQLVGAWTWGSNANNLGTDENNASVVGSSVYYVMIVVCQMGHLLSIRKRQPYFYEAIMKLVNREEVNWVQEVKDNLPTVAVLLAWVGAILSAVFFTEVPAIQTSCQTASVPGLHWGLAFGWCALAFTVGEIRKWLIILFPKSIGRFAW